MTEQFKAIITRNNLYREVQINEEMESIRIGTGKKCRVRFDKKNFFEEFDAEIKYENKKWQIFCSENIYISVDGIMKLTTRELKHGDKIVLKYRNSNQEVLNISFMVDFDYELKKYNRIIDISNYNQIRIGGDKNCDIYLTDELIENDVIYLSNRDDKYYLKDENTKYGVYINGQRIKNEAQIFDFDFISIVGYSFYFKYGKLHTSSSEMTISNIEFTDSYENSDYPKFNRNTRMKSVIPDESISILDPPQLPPKPEKNLLTSLIPSFAMLALMVVLRGVIGGGGTFVLFSACSMSLGIATSIFSFINGKKEYKKSIYERESKYNFYIEKKRNEINFARQDEKNILEDIYYSSERKIKMIDEFSGDLFDRQEGDDDFLDVYIGNGLTEAKRKIDYKMQEKFETNDELAEIPQNISDEYKLIEKSPVVCKISLANAVGIIGIQEHIYEMLKIMVLDLCTRQYPKDVKLFFTVSEENLDKVSWVRFLPHVKNDILGIRNIICDEKSKNILFEYLYKEMTNREELKIKRPHLIIFVYDDLGMKKHPISKFIEKSKDIGVTFIFFDNKKQLIPQGCDLIINLNENDETGKLMQSNDVNTSTNFSYFPISEQVVDNMALKLAPVYCEEISLESTLTKNISLYKLLDIISVDDLDLSSRWSKSQVFKSMAAPIGVKTKNEIVYLDLHDKAHGPHGLVAGTTGSGKSEILQTYILSMATLFHPYEISFVIIDFKGGGMVNQFRTLPHLVGAITNIDGREIERSLKSIKAELKKRQRLFADADVNHIDKYIKKFKSNEVKEPLPHLIVIVDEFAELKAEQPEFMKELISAARIGRSLGVHLILATQKPAGQVNEQIWSNSKFKLCLKVQSQSDSNEVLKSPLAAEIKEPGRAYLQVGNNEIFELFQSAYSGCLAKIDDSAYIKEFKISEVSFSGMKKLVFEQKKPKSDAADETQLGAVVSYVHNYCAENQIKKLPDICLPSLPECITLESDTDFVKSTDIISDIGIYDDPDNQYQGKVSCNLGVQNTMIIGSSQYGKTNLLQWIIKNLSERYSPEELNIYILDFASMVLKNFESLCHVGGVVCASDDEKLKNLFKLINDEMNQRKEKLLSVGVSSFISYKEAGYKDIPQIMLIVDNLTALKEMYLNENDEILHICREGISVGISVIVANTQLSGIGYKYLSNFSNKIALYCNESSEYGSLFGSCRMKPSAVAGRGIIEIDKTFYECQTFLSFYGEKEIDRVNEMRKFIRIQNDKYDGMGAKAIPVIPKVLTNEFIHQNYKMKLKPYSYIVGLDYSDVSIQIFDFVALNLISLIGREGSGRGNFVKNMFSELSHSSENYPVNAVIIDDIVRKFECLKEKSAVEKYSLLADDVKDVISSWHEKLKKRYDMMINGNNAELEKLPLLLLIIQNSDVHNVISSDKETLIKYKEILGKYKALKVCVFYANVENIPIAFGAPDTLKMIKDNKNYIIFDDIPNIKITDIPLQFSRQFKKPIEIGDAYYIKESTIKKIKTVLSTEK